VATLASEGLTNREIAHTLYVTPKTIEAHLAAAYRKLGVSGKAALKGLLDDGLATELA
jgi:DNA-binding NarL/FixJ family response regulator